MENEHELGYETLTRVYLGSYEHYKGVGAEVEHSKPGFELQGAKMVETGQNRDFRLRTARVTTPGLRWACAFHQDKASSVKVPVANVTLFSLAHLLRENTDSEFQYKLLGLLVLLWLQSVASTAVVRSAISCRMASKVMAGVSDVDVLLGGIL
ncbi:hypothetical protein Tco_0526540 [Tanacetum coccineum]